MYTKHSCYKCENRKVGCHSNCEIYNKYKMGLDVINSRKKQFKENEYNPRRCKIWKITQK